MFNLSDSFQKLPLFQTLQPVRWESLSWSEIESLQQQGTDMCILPIGATEQHGPHLPVYTDSAIVTAVCLYASAATRIPVLPTLTYGCSLGHTERWSGTLSLFPETLSVMVRELAEWLVRTGWRRLLIVNSHFGNLAPIRCAIDRLRFEYPGKFQIGVRNTYELSPEILQYFLHDGDDVHANRAETALMLVIDPNAVKLQQLQDDPDRTSGKIFTYVVPQTSTNGVTGNPSLATTSEGKQLLIQMGEALVALIESAKTEEPPIQWCRDR
ncbi:MAG: creatininase family protein [Plectolyngbya sp. WJT66-NPBG17]|jgi:creatinine amidohydrolase|nr:creatininase family protein [Plectolyngbya sp. WJT66-NPBG17]